MATATETTAYAIIQTGGKQYKVSEGDIITIEKLSDDHKAGDKVIFDHVLLFDDGSKLTMGTPVVEKAKVEAEVLDAGKAKKVVVIKYRSKSRHFIKKGHRQPFVKVKITSIK